jgi:hypothetical protein
MEQKREVDGNGCNKTHGKIQVENADNGVLAGLSALGVII